MEVVFEGSPTPRVCGDGRPFISVFARVLE